jgi:hypothetical protein
MGDSMSTIINATTTNGVVIQPDNSGSLVLQTNSGTTALTIDTSQRVGIGTASPSEKLHVVGSIASSDVFIPLNSTTAIGYIGNSNPITGGSSTNVGIRAESAMLFATGGATERMRIDSSGNVLVGKTALPSSSVYGFAINASSNNFQYLMNSVGTTGGGTHFEFYNPNGKVGNINTSGSGTSYVTTSDYRLKENVAPMTGALDKIAQLKPVTYKWKIDGSDGQGFIAHELQAIVPDCVTGEKDAVDAEGNPEYQGVDTSFLVATLTAAIQEQQTIINDLKARIETLEAK